GPLAAALDDVDGDTAMASAIARTRSAIHPELAATYANIIHAVAVEQGLVPKQPGDVPVPTGAAREQLLAKLPAAHADELLIGALLQTSADRFTVDRADIAEFAKLTAASPDPWFQLLGLSQQATLSFNAGDLVGAEAILLRGQARCREAHAPAYRCI